MSLITNMPINDSFFEKHARFFASIGYIALQIAPIEDEIRLLQLEIRGHVLHVEIERRLHFGQRKSPQDAGFARRAPSS